MAIFHMSVKAISRSAGRSATAAAAYRAGEKIVDERTGEIHDYTRKAGVIESGIVVPGSTWTPTRTELWNAAELAEKRKDSCVAREHIVALPSELTPEQRLSLVKNYAKDLMLRHRCAVDYALHEPSKEGDDRNYHAHILCTTREVKGLGLGQKCDREKSGRDRKKDLEGERKDWAFWVNYELKRAGIDERVDHRSLKDQGIEDRVPTTHVGPTVTAIKRRGGESEVLARIEVQVTERLRLAKAAGELERELAGIKHLIIDTKTRLDQALADRQRAFDLDRQHQAEAKKQEEKRHLLHLQLLAEAKELEKQQRQAAAEAQREHEQHQRYLRLLTEAKGEVTAPHQVSMPEAPTIVISLEETLDDFITLQQATATNSGRREEWRKPREDERVSGPILSTKNINGKQYAVVSGGPNRDRSAQMMILVHDEQAHVLLLQKQSYRGRCVTGEMVRDSSMSPERSIVRGR